MGLPEPLPVGVPGAVLVPDGDPLALPVGLPGVVTTVDDGRPGEAELVAGSNDGGGSTGVVPSTVAAGVLGRPPVARAAFDGGAGAVW